MERMRVTGRHVATRVVFLVSSLLLLVASCSLQKRVSHNAGGRGFVANEFCSACHYSFADESLARIHEIAGIGCERCHGESERHRSDEGNVTLPEIMYPRDKIIPTCMMCHPRHEIRHVPAHEAFLAGAKTSLDSAPQSDVRTLVCTDCHAKEHHIKVRAIRWNKATGERIKE